MKYNEMIKSNVTRNHEGGEAFPLSPELELYTAVVTTALSNMTYETSDKRIKRICQLIQKVNPEFVAQLAIYTREQMNLRSIPLLLVVELAKIHNGDNLVARAVNRIVLRADEIMELLTCYQVRNPSENSIKKLGHLSRQIQKGLALAFNRFDEYQFAKYNNTNRVVKMRDVLFIVHPKAKDDSQQKLFDKIVLNELATPYTWEAELSALGQKQFDTEDEKLQAFSNKWQGLIASGQLGYMAILRNLRNILHCKNLPGGTINSVIARLTSFNAIAKAHQLPFRYLAAYREVQKIDSFWTQSILEALEEAVEKTAGNIAGFDESTCILVAADVSGSMFSAISEKSRIQNYDIGLLLAMMLKSRCKQVVSGMFGDTWKIINLPTEHILANVQEMYKREGEVGYSTNGYKVIDWMVENKIIIDKIMIFTDCQMWNSNNTCDSIRLSWHKYLKISPKANLYLFDLCGYGQAPLSMAEPGVSLIAGWNDKIFDILAALEKGNNALAEIKDIEV